MKPHAPVAAVSQQTEDQKAGIRPPELRHASCGGHPVIINSGWTITGQLATGRQARVFLCSLGSRQTVLRVPIATNSREAEVYAALAESSSAREPGFTRCLEVVDIEIEGQKGRGYLLEYGGESLRSRLQRERTVSESVALGIHEQVCAAIRWLARLGYYHTDVGPSNILIGEGGRVKLCDLGSAVRIAEFTPSHYRTNRRYGAPACYLGNPDLFSAALTLFEAVSGEHLIAPFNAEENFEGIKQRTELLKAGFYTDGALSPIYQEKIATTGSAISGHILQLLNLNNRESS